MIYTSQRPGRAPGATQGEREKGERFGEKGGDAIQKIPACPFATIEIICGAQWVLYLT